MLQQVIKAQQLFLIPAGHHHGRSAQLADASQFDYFAHHAGADGAGRIFVVHQHFLAIGGAKGLPNGAGRLQALPAAQHQHRAAAIEAREVAHGGGRGASAENRLWLRGFVAVSQRQAGETKGDDEAGEGGFHGRKVRDVRKGQQVTA